MRLLLLLLFPLLSHAQSDTRIVEGAYFPNAPIFKNYIKNGSCDKNANDITAGATMTVSANSTNKIKGPKSCGLNAGAANDTATWSVFTTEQEMWGKTCEIDMKYFGDGTLYNVGVLVGGSPAVTSSTFLNATTVLPMTVSFPCPVSSGQSVSMVVKSTGDGAAFNIDDVYLGLMRPTNLAYSSGVLPVARGGTNLSSFTNGDVLIATGPTTISGAPINVSGAYLITKVINGVSTPAWQHTLQNELRLDTCNGYGSINTNVRRWTNVTTNGTAMTLTQSSTNGDSITINYSGMYCSNFSDNMTALSVIAITVNFTGASSSAAANQLLSKGTATANQIGETGGCMWLTAGDVIRAATQGTVVDTASRCRWSIIKIH